MSSLSADAERFKTNLAHEKKFSELLQNVVTRYKNRSIEAAQVIKELIQMAKKFREASGLGEALGLNEEQLVIYDALVMNEASVRELSDEVLANITHGETASLRSNVSLDWSQRDRFHAKLHLMVTKRILRKYKYPQD